MSTTRRLSVALLAALLAALLPSAALAIRNDVVQVQGATNEATAIALSQLAFDSADTVLIGRDDVFADSLSSGGLQGTDSPLLLTDTDDLSAAVEAEITRLGATDAVILGGTDAVSEEVADDLEALNLDVTRLSGATRLETAIDVADELGGTTAVLVRAFPASGGDETQAFADSIAAGAWAAENGWPVLFTQTEVLSGSTRTHLAQAGITDLHVIGGEAAISTAVTDTLDEMGISWERTAGANRFATAIEIAEARGFDTEDDAAQLVLVEGQGADAWAAGFAAAAYSAANDAPIVLANGDNLPPETEAFLSGTRSFAVDEDDVDGVVLVCASDPDACAEATAELGLPSDATITITTTGEVDPGGIVEGTFDDDGQGADLEVQGCGNPAGTDVGVAPNDSFQVAVSASQATDCSLAFEITFPNGTIQTETFAVNVDEPGGSGTQSGVIIAVNDGANTYSFVTSGGATVNVSYDDADVFQIGGATSSVTAWENVSAVGNTVSFSDDTSNDDLDVHNLTDTDPVDSGTLANIDISSDSFDIIEPNTGTVLNTIGDYSGETYRIGSTSVAEAAFEADLNEGDTIVINDLGGANERYDLTNRSVSGMAENVVSAGGTVTFDIGGLGNDPTDNTPSNAFVAEAGDTFTGAASTVYEFGAGIDAGDVVTVTRVGGVETFRLDNGAPPTVTGTATEAIDTVNDVVTYLPTGSGADATFDYTGTATYRVNNVIVAEGEFEAAYTAGDTLQFTPDDPDTGANEQVLNLTNNNLTGLVEDFQTGAATLDVVNAQGGTIHEDLDFGAGATIYGGAQERYFVTGVNGEVSLNDFKLAIAEDGDANSTITVAPLGSGLGRQFTFTP